MRKMTTTILVWAALTAPASAQIIDFEDLTLPGPNTFFNGSSNIVPPGTVSTIPFTSRGAVFNNYYNTMFGGYWGGWSYSNVVNTITPGVENQYASYAGGGDGSPNYGVAYQDFFTPVTPTILLPFNNGPMSVRITNTTYAALSMRDGDSFAKKFGGVSGNDPDYFRLTIRGFDAGSQPTGVVEFYLADYRFSNNAEDYIVSQWTTVNLTPLGQAVRLSFELDSSDNGMFGMNTPAYFALDNLVPVPEPSSMIFTSIGLAVAWRIKKRKGTPR